MQEAGIDTIDEPVKVLASFALPNIKIHSFFWRDRIYKVEATTMFHIANESNRKIYHFSVSSGGNAYDLAFDPISLSWLLTSAVQV